ncbi:MAG: amidase [Clostridia bacterium]|nr:amidase [Clostridia bacterium]
MKRIFSIILALILLLSSFTMAFAEDKPTVEKESILSALYEADITTIRTAIENCVISCEELTSYYIERIEKYNSKYNCFITICYDSLDVAKERDTALANGENSGSLFGVPIVIKDNMDLEGYYTTNGHKFENSEIATDNARVVSLLLEEGAVIVGKTNMSTDAQDARTSYSKVKGETKNAYSTLLSAGGSSGGTASAVSLNFAAAGLGTDTNSSLRIPAILNGCYSLRPTLNKISFDGCTHLNNSRDVVGAVTRSVYDQAIMLDVLTENKYSYERNLNPNALNGMKFGILSELTYPVSTSLITETDEELREKKIKQFDIQYRTENNIDSEISSAFNKAVSNLQSCGAEVVTVSMPQLFESAYKTFEKHDFSIKKEFYNEVKAFMDKNELDALIFPTYLSTPLKSGTDSSGKYWNVWNQVFLNNCRVLSPSTSMPEMSLLIGYHSSGAGIGMEILSDKNTEQMLLNIAYSYTSRFECRKSPTGAPDLYSKWNIGSMENILEKYNIPALSDRVIIIETTTKPTTTQPVTEETTVTETETESITETTFSTTSETEVTTNEKIDEDEKSPSILPILLIIAGIVMIIGATVFLIIKKRKE